MAIQLSVAVRNARLNAIEKEISGEPPTNPGAVMRIRTGAPPVNCAASDSGTVLASLNLPSDWMAAASGGSKALSGTWQDADADASGTAGHFRIYDSGGSICHMQGTVTATGNGGDLTLDNISINASQTVTITAFTWTDGNS